MKRLDFVYGKITKHTVLGLLSSVSNVLLSIDKNLVSFTTQNDSFTTQNENHKYRTAIC